MLENLIKRLPMLKHNGKRLLCSSKTARDLYAQAQLQEASIETELQINLFEVEHLI